MRKPVFKAQARRVREETKAPNIVALSPAHNEAERIAASVAAPYRQQRPPHRIVVFADLGSAGQGG
ncbi:hypothetical protein ACH4U6_31520 [Streptomyces netropsis]|uniref:hypothetical protein n=1 Tax=Streptomyces netropsis TaxID=55404 RepID=UPI0037A49DE9